VDVMESYETLVTIYQGEEPWQSDIDAVMLNRRGKEVIIGRTIVGSIIHKLGESAKDAVKTENLAGVAAGTGVFFLSSGNFGLAAATNSIVHDVIANRKYDRNPKELLTQLPMDALGGLLTQSGVQPGRIFNVIALGMSQGILQGVATKQDPFKSALVGATLETGLEFLPFNIRYPMFNGVTKNVLTKNAAIEVVTTSAKTAFRGGVVAVLEKQDVVKGMQKGAVYGATVSIFKIAVLGARYNPLHGTTSSDVQDMIDEENAYDNANGAPGGNYQITQKTIQNTPYRAGGWLPIQIDASITLPGNVSMHPEQLDIETVVHESHHLSQQEQLGLFRFYYQYLYESLTTPYWDLSFEISAH